MKTKCLRVKQNKTQLANQNRTAFVRKELATRCCRTNGWEDFICHSSTFLQKVSVLFSQILISTFALMFRLYSGFLFECASNRTSNTKSDLSRWLNCLLMVPEG